MSLHWFHAYLYSHYSRKRDSALDIGCGTRPYHSYFNCNYIGLDLTSRTNEELKPDIFSDSAILPFKDNSFDFIISSSVIPWIKNIDSAFDEMYRVLKPHGILVLINVNLKGLALHPKMKHYNKWNSLMLNKKIREHGFKSILKRNLKALVWATYFDLTSVYSYIIATPKK